MIGKIVLISIIILYVGLIFFLGGCQTPYVDYPLGIGDIDKIVTSDEWVCLEDGFDAVCLKAIPGPPGKDGKDGKTIYLIPSQSLTQAVHVIPQQILTQAVHVIHADNLSFADPIPVPAVQIEEPESDLITSRTIYVEAWMHITGAIIIIPARDITSADKVIYVSNLTTSQVVVALYDNAIWHIKIHETPNGVEIYVYPRSLPPNDRLRFYPGSGTELQGTRQGVNELLRVYLSEHNTHILSVLGDETIIDAELR